MVDVNFFNFFMKLRTEKVFFVTYEDWDDFVSEVYGKPYSLEKQKEGISSTYVFDVPNNWDKQTDDTYYNESYGVPLDYWKRLNADIYTFSSIEDFNKFWHKEMFPDVRALLNDLNKQGIIETGKYVIGNPEYYQ